MKKKLSAAILAAIVALCPFLFPHADYRGFSEVRSAMKYVIHGGGQLDGHNLYGEDTVYTCSNSAEGLAQCAYAGCPVIEIDFNFTADGSLACIHDWYHMYAEEIETDVALTYGQFKNVKIYRQFTSQTIDDVAVFLRDHPGTYIVTDIKDDNIRGLGEIARLYPDLTNRFIAQIYSYDEYAPVKALGYNNIVFTLYRLTWNQKTDAAGLADFAQYHALVGYTFAGELCDLDGYVERMKKCGIPLFVHTVDGEEERQRYFDMGIDGIYTNEVVCDTVR